MKFFIKSFGCPTNYVESDILREILLKNGWEEVKNENEADYIFVFTCGVKKKKMFTFVHEIFLHKGNILVQK